MGAIIISILSLFSDLAGVIGSGTSILLASNTIYSIFEKYFNLNKKNKNVINFD